MGAKATNLGSCDKHLTYCKDSSVNVPLCNERNVKVNCNIDEYISLILVLAKVIKSLSLASYKVECVLRVSNVYEKQYISVCICKKVPP